MPRLQPRQLLRAIEDAYAESDASVLLVSPLRSNPRRFIVTAGRNSFEVWAYIWTLTHGGGRHRPTHEYRIQMTGIESPIEVNPNGMTLLLGFEPDTQCFAGFDITKHFTFTGRSPSIQIPITVLHDALQNGFSFKTKGNDEIAIGIRPDQLLAYTLNSIALHEQGADADTVSFLSRVVVQNNISDEELERVPVERQRIVRTVSRLSRDSSFRRKVITAYDRRCAVTRAQLRLIDAAHILPVVAEASRDDVTNGLCLSPTYHRAFDQALIYLDTDLKMQINRDREAALIESGLAGGLEQFKSFLNTRIHLPEDKQLWPNLQYIRDANRFRGIR